MGKMVGEGMPPATVLIVTQSDLPILRSKDSNAFLILKNR